MKYLIYFSPTENVTTKIEGYRTMLGSALLSTPSAGLHCTLFNLYSNYNNEQGLIDIVESLKLRKMDLVLSHIELFDEQMLVIRISKSDDLEELHNTIVTELREFVDWRHTPPILEKYSQDHIRQAVYKKCGSPYFLACYAPHLTVGKVSTEFVQLREFFSGTSFSVDRIHLARKEKDGWKHIAAFDLQ
jgi:2'-5' RNA ligase